MSASERERSSAVGIGAGGVGWATGRGDRIGDGASVVDELRRSQAKPRDSGEKELFDGGGCMGSVMRTGSATIVGDGGPVGS